MSERLREWLRAKEAIASRKDREERWNRPSQYNRYERHLADFRQKQLDDLAAERELEKQRLANQGQLDVEQARQTGATTRTGMTEAGLTTRFGQEQAGINRRFDRTQDDKFRYLAQQQAGDQELEELRSLSRLNLLDREQQGRLDLLEREFDLRMQEPQYREVSSVDPLTGESVTSWIDVGRTLREMDEIDSLADGSFTNAPTRTNFANQTLEDYNQSAAQAFGPTRRTVPQRQPAPSVTPQRPLATLTEPAKTEPVTRSPYVTDRLAPLKSVTRSLNQTIGSGADAMVRRYQRDPYDF